MKTFIKNGRVVDPSQKLDAVMDILVEDGKIKALGKDIAEASDLSINNEVQNFFFIIKDKFLPKTILFIASKAGIFTNGGCRGFK